MTAKAARARYVSGRKRRTYLPLEELRHKPSDYEVTTTGLLYYPSRGFEVETPVWEHYLAHQRAGVLQCDDWDSFEDPARTTYSSYVAARRDQEVFLDRLLERVTTPLPAELLPLVGLISAWRFPLHGFQMTAAYIGSLAPSGRITVVAAFQAADELRRVQRLCQWLSRVATSASEIDARGRELWQHHARLQPLRRLVEELLVTYDWGRALVVLNGLIKPVFDRLWFVQVASSVARHGAEALDQVLKSAHEDARWHEAWFAALLRHAWAHDAANGAAFVAACRALQPQVLEAVHELLPLFDGVLGVRATGERLEADLSTQLSAIGSNLPPVSAEVTVTHGA